jgi:hydroxypyruvate reductase 1
MSIQWNIHNPSGKKRIIVTRDLPGSEWKEAFTEADCSVEILSGNYTLTTGELCAAIGDRCDGILGLLFDQCNDGLFEALANAGGKVYSNYAVGFNNIDLPAATRRNIAVGNTPGVLTETTAELAVALTFAAARRIVEGDLYTRGGKFTAWMPDLLLGELLWRKTFGIIGAGRIGASYARMMIEGHKMNLLYYDNHPNAALEIFLNRYASFLQDQGEEPTRWKRVPSIEELLKESDVVSLHVPLTQSTWHMIDQSRLSLMKENAILVNTSRGPVIDEKALVTHCKTHPHFRAGLDVYEDEPVLAPGLQNLENIILLPHVGSGTLWARRNMALIAALNIIGILKNYPVWHHTDMIPFLRSDRPHATPSILNAKELQLPVFHG